MFVHGPSRLQVWPPLLVSKAPEAGGLFPLHLVMGRFWCPNWARQCPRNLECEQLLRPGVHASSPACGLSTALVLSESHSLARSLCRHQSDSSAALPAVFHRFRVWSLLWLLWPWHAASTCWGCTPGLGPEAPGAAGAFLMPFRHLAQ